MHQQRTGHFGARGCPHHTGALDGLAWHAKQPLQLRYEILTLLCGLCCVYTCRAVTVSPSTVLE